MSDLEKLRSEGDSKYNSSLDILQRINRIIEFSVTASFANDLHGLHQWRNALSALEREVKPYCNSDEIEQLRVHAVSDLPDVHTVKSYRANVDVSAIRKRLEQWENTIRVLLGKKGMGLKASKDPGKSILD